MRWVGLGLLALFFVSQDVRGEPCSHQLFAESVAIRRQLLDSGLFLLNAWASRERPGFFRWVWVRSAQGRDWIVGQRLKNNALRPDTQSHSWVHKRVEEILPDSTYVMGGTLRVVFELGTSEVIQLDVADVGGKDLDGSLDPNSAHLGQFLSITGLKDVRFSSEGVVEVLWGRPRKIRHFQSPDSGWITKLAQ